MEGEDSESDSADAFGKKSVYKRMIIVAAGAIMNIILGIVFMAVILAQQPRFASTTVSSFADEAVTQQTGLQIGDKIMEMDGYKVSTYTDIGFVMSINKDFKADIVVERNGEVMTLNDVNFATRESENGNTVVVRDFYLAPIQKNLWTMTVQIFKEMVSNVRMIYATLIGMVTGTLSVHDVSGPVGLVSMISSAASEGLKTNITAALNNIINIMMVFTVNLGIFNLLPVPALDGGRLVFLIIEAIKGKPLLPKYEGIVHTVGFILLILLMLLVSVNDVMKLFSEKG